MSNDIIVAGIDPSLSATAVVVGSSPDDFADELFGSTNQGDTCRQRVDRYQMLIQRIMLLIDDRQPSLILLEGYSHGSKTSGMTQTKMSEFGGLLRLYLLDHADVIEVPPATLKKFVLGKGTGKKDVMLKEVYKRWGYDTDSDDEADAYGLFRMGLMLAGKDEPANAKQSEALDVVRKSHDLSEVG